MSTVNTDKNINSKKTKSTECLEFYITKMGGHKATLTS